MHGVTESDMTERLTRTHGNYAGAPSGSVVKNPPANAGDTGSIPGLGRSPGEENGTPLQYSCLGNPMDRGAWGREELGMTENAHTHHVVDIFQRVKPIYNTFR